MSGAKHAGRVLYGIAALACVVLVASLLAPVTEADSTAPGVSAPGPLASATVNPDGTWTVTTSSPAWTFGGDVSAPVSGISTAAGHDRIGSFEEISFSYQAGGPRRSSIRTYDQKPIVLFSTTYLAESANSAPFPVITTHPQLPYNESFVGPITSTAAACNHYRFNNTNGVDGSPFLSFDSDDNSYLVSAASHFEIADTTVSSNGDISSGIMSQDIPSLPAGFTQQTMLAFGNGINATYGTWGHALTSLTGKTRPANDQNAYLNKIGYWTDHGASYFYHYDASRGGYEGTLEAVKDSWEQQGLPLGYVQLDGWYYPKGPDANWQDNSPGIYLYQADPQLFPQGLAAFQQQLGLPLAVQAKHIDPSSPYHSEYTMSNNVITDPRYWNDRMSYLGASGVIDFEQDFLCWPSHSEPNFNLTDPDAFFGNMANGAAANDIAVQYSLPQAKNLLQSTEYNNFDSTRVSGDRFVYGEWDQYLYDSRLAGAVGLWPFSDVVHSSETKNLLLSLLSAGPVGVGDAIGAEDRGNILRAVRPDGALVKPDAPIAPVDASYIADAQGEQAPMVASTHTDFGHGQRAAYVFAYARPDTATQAATFTPGEVGVHGWAYVYDYFTGAGQLVPPGKSYTAEVSGDGSYYVVVPAQPSGIAFLGDTGQFVPLGKKRVTSVVSQGDKLTATIAFTPGEGQVTLEGYAPQKPDVSAAPGVAGPVSYDPGTGLFRVAVGQGPGHTATVTMGNPSAAPAAGSGYGPVTVSGSSQVQAGQPASITGTFRNSGGTVSNVQMSLQAPAGWSVTPATPAAFPTVAPGASVQTTWQVTPGRGSQPVSTASLTARATYTSGNPDAPGNAEATSSGGWQLDNISPVQAPYQAFASTAQAVTGQAGNQFEIGSNTGAGNYAAIYQPASLGPQSAVTVKVASLNFVSYSPNAPALGQPEAGILVRDNIAKPKTSPGYVTLAATPAGIILRWDDTGSGTLDQQITVPYGPSAPVWLKLARNGPAFTAYYSNNGQDWTQIGTANPAGTTTTEDAGMFGIISNAQLALGEAQFSGFNIG